MKKESITNIKNKLKIYKLLTKNIKLSTKNIK